MNDREKKFIPDEDVYLFNTGARARRGCASAAAIFGAWGAPLCRLGAECSWVSLVGDFNSWDRAATPMECIDGGVWVCFVEGLSDGVLYKFCVTGADGHEILKSDPFAAWSEHGENTASKVWKGGSYKWTDESYMSRRAARDFMREPMSIYERTPAHGGSGGRSPPTASLPILSPSTASTWALRTWSLCPSRSTPSRWELGLSGHGVLRPDLALRQSDDFKYLVDKAHHTGIGVIMDWVPAHFPKDEHGLANFDGTPLFECKERRMAEHPEWGTLVFDYASDQVQSFLVSSACKFFEEYHIDGIRVDAVSSMLYSTTAAAPASLRRTETAGI